jgi:hypothetical protein
MFFFLSKTKSEDTGTSKKIKTRPELPNRMTPATGSEIKVGQRKK